MSLAESRSSVVAAFADASATLRVYDHVPEQLQAGAAVVTSGSPWLSSDGEPFGYYRVRWDVLIVTDVAENATATAWLDSAITLAAQSLHAHGLAVEEVGEPFDYQSNGVLHLAAFITVTDSITL